MEYRKLVVLISLLILTAAFIICLVYESSVRRNSSTAGAQGNIRNQTENVMKGDNRNTQGLENQNGLLQQTEAEDAEKDNPQDAIDPSGKINGDTSHSAEASEDTQKSFRDHMMVYVNWDGFAWYYYLHANNGGVDGTPVINGLVRDGVLFSNAESGVPSITNPMQTAIVTGAWPDVTGNCYQYFDRITSTAIKTGRENKAENLAEAVTRQGLRAVSIHQFILENRGTYAGSSENPYIQLGNGVDYSARFDEAIRYVKNLGAGRYPVELPAFLAIYMDDLDGIGHNNWFTYGVPAVKTEKERLESVIKRLKQMDAKMGEFIEACKAAGIYDKTSFLLATDHGMTPYGLQNGYDDGFGRSKLPDLVKELENLGYKTEVLTEGKSAKKDTDIVLAPTGLQVQLIFPQGYAEADAGIIMEALKQKEYIGVILDKAELEQRGAAEQFADMLISPKPPYCLKNDSKLHRAGGQHDSLDETSQHVFALMWGKGLKKGYTVNKKIHIIDFAKTMAALMGIDPPKNATGNLLEEVLEK